MKQITFEPKFESWQVAAREAVRENLSPEEIVWNEGHTAQTSLELFSDARTFADIKPDPSANLRVPKAFLEIAKMVSRHSDSARWSLLYRALWRLTHGESNFLENPADADVVSLRQFEREVARDGYRMKQYIRFREVQTESGTWFVAWYEPDHDSVDLNTDFFTERFHNMRWSILTPIRCMHWDGETISFTKGVDKSVAPTEDAVETLWTKYYSSIFNPARVKVKAMKAQMPTRVWKNLPEASVIAPLLQNAPRRVASMIANSDTQRVRETDYGIAQPPQTDDWSLLHDAAKSCRACPLWKNATCAVFGEGPRHPRVVFVGEQPGDQEDRVGKPFIGPAGQLLDRALAEAGVNREEVYVTNAVKHFKWEPRGKRRVHKTANAREIAACRPWLEAELDLLKPQLIVSMGATAAQSIFRTKIRVTQERGKFLDSQFGKVLVTVHPSSLLRLADPSQQPVEFTKFVNDLGQIHAMK